MIKWIINLIKKKKILTHNPRPHMISAQRLTKAMIGDYMDHAPAPEIMPTKRATRIKRKRASRGGKNFFDVCDNLMSEEDIEKARIESNVMIKEYRQNNKLEN